MWAGVDTDDFPPPILPVVYRESPVVYGQTMENPVSIGAPPIEVNIRRSARARRYSLRVSNTDGKVNLTLPSRAPLSEALAFAERQEAWLRKTLSSQPQLITPEYGGRFLFEGQDYTLKHGPGRRVVLGADKITVPGTAETLAAKLRGFCKVRARERLFERTNHHANQLGRPFGRMTIRDTSSRWGSCSQEGNLMYSWRLIMAPPAVLNYVVAHEVAHLAELNHSAAFWRLVARLDPDFETNRRWLKTKGPLLHSYRF